MIDDHKIIKVKHEEIDKIHHHYTQNGAKVANDLVGLD